MFKLVSDFKPSGDQPEAINHLVQGIKDGMKAQTLLGVTGSGKTFTMANIIERVQRPTLVLAHNKTLAGQLYAEFKELAEVYAEKRLANMNRILGTGWLDDDSYDRLSLRTPYDLFIAKDYSSVDVSSIYNDFGPKWYLEAYEDPETYEVLFRIPVDQNLLPPAAAWSVPFYMAALDPDTYQAFTAPQVAGELFFPVEYDEENDVVVIKPFEYNGVKYYPNILGYDASSGGSILENPVVSEIVLTRGWTEPEVETKSAARGAAGNVPVRADLPKGVYKKMTELKPAAELQEIQVELVSGEQIKERADKLVERFLNQTR